MGNVPVTELKTELTSVIRLLGECQDVLVRNGNGEAAQLISMALLQVRMRVHQVGDAELRALCDTVMAEHAQTRAASHETAKADIKPIRPPLRSVK